MNIKEIADALGLTTRQIANLVVDRMPRVKKGRSWDYGLDAVVWYFTRKLERLEAERPVGLEAERTALVRAQRMKAEYELAQIQGTMLSIDFHQEEKNRVYGRIRAKLLNFPGWMAPRVAGRKVGEAQRALEDGVNEILEVLSTGDDADTSSDAPKRTRKRVAKGRGRGKKVPSPKAAS